MIKAWRWMLFFFTDWMHCIKLITRRHFTFSLMVFGLPWSLMESHSQLMCFDTFCEKSAHNTRLLRKISFIVVNTYSVCWGKKWLFLSLIQNHPQSRLTHICTQITSNYCIKKKKNVCVTFQCYLFQRPWGEKNHCTRASLLQSMVYFGPFTKNGMYRELYTFTHTFILMKSPPPPPPPPMACTESCILLHTLSF